MFEKYKKLGVTEISNIMRMYKSAVFGIVSTLVINKILEKNHSKGRYKLGLELYRLVHMVNHSIRNIVLPYLELLVETYQETANLVMLKNSSVIYLEKIKPTFNAYYHSSR